jgi:cell wall-associated NlpC family hydrolase
MPASTLDKRVTPCRPDRAAARLRGRVDAETFVEGVRRAVTAPSVPLRRGPDADSVWETEALFGEACDVYDDEAGWSWVQLERDSYVGYLPTASLGAAIEPTHVVATPRAHAYPAPSIKRQPLFALAMGARLSIARADGDFLITADGIHIFARHLAPVGHGEADFVAVAERFLHAPYLWGGRTWEGIDCSGLVQTALTATGTASPRDSDMMEAGLGAPLPADEILRRGDLVFWKGHVGVMRDPLELLHANGWHMKVVSETLAEARARIAGGGGGRVTSIRRLGGPSAP